MSITLQRFLREKKPKKRLMIVTSMPHSLLEDLFHMFPGSINLNCSLKLDSGIMILIKDEKKFHYLQECHVLQYKLKHPTHFNVWYTGVQELDLRKDCVEEYLCL